jgi:hypothetical protein
MAAVNQRFPTFIFAQKTFVSSSSLGMVNMCFVHKFGLSVVPFDISHVLFSVSHVENLL